MALFPQLFVKINDFYIVLFSATFCYKVGQTPNSVPHWKKVSRWLRRTELSDYSICWGHLRDQFIILNLSEHGRCTVTHFIFRTISLFTTYGLHWRSRSMYPMTSSIQRQDWCNIKFNRNVFFSAFCQPYHSASICKQIKSRSTERFTCTQRRKPSRQLQHRISGTLDHLKSKNVHRLIIRAIEHTVGLLP